MGLYQAIEDAAFRRDGEGGKAGNYMTPMISHDNENMRKHYVDKIV